MPKYLLQPSDFSHRTSDVKPQTSRRTYLSPVIPLIIVKTLGYSKNFLYFCTKSLRYE